MSKSAPRLRHPGLAGIGRSFLTAAFVAGLAACSGPRVEPGFARGEEAARLLGTEGVGAPVEYRIAPTDVIRLQVLYEQDLSAERLQVDAGGNIMVPLIGQVRASGLTEAELATVVRQRLSQYLKRPDVTISLVTATRQRVVVEGFVTEPGVYDIGGSATLLEVMARAKSPTNRAALEQIVVIRMINGRRHGAVFNLNRIRTGLDPDPTILGGDRVVVGYSALRGAFRDILTAGPLLSIFRPF
jgi:polysaccharide export outer membrane protein